MSSDMDSGSSQLPYAYAKATPEVEQAARRTVARHALDEADCRELIEMLNLLPKGEP